MEIRKKISGFITLTCVSFTIITLLYIALAEWMDADLTRVRIFCLFAVCAMVGAVILVTDFIPVGSLLLRLLIDFVDVALTVFLFGGVVLKLFPFHAKIIFTVFGMLTAAFAGAAALAIVNDRLASQAINQKIAEMKTRR